MMTTEEELELARKEAEHWKSVALYLADCHAATATYDGLLKSVSKARRERFASICQKAFNMITMRESPPSLSRRRTVDDVADRLANATKELLLR